ncbi:hypothetical protein BGZ65_006765 [Modicella reniformis]|uniref:Mitochondrial carrier n=1 Tax=Modicella reniformis TaxID=1440133 RepID=A0A9P6JHB9_9FUNG|nr:hypothetical protein BGZ65_006765 [Modicella reniformis]
MSTTNNNTNTGSDQGTVNRLIASTIAALCSRLCTHPLDTVKTRVQVSNTPLPLLPTFLNLLQNGGLYRGLPIALALSAPGLSVYLTVYDLSKDAISRCYRFPYLSSDSVINHMASAVVAEVSSGLIWTPMEVLKSKQQVENMTFSSSSITSSTTTTTTSGTHHHKAVAAAVAATSNRKPISTVELARRIYHQEGLLGFYRGYFITLGVFVPYSMIYFATYEQMKVMAWRQRQRHSHGFNGTGQHRDTLPFWTIMTCAAVAAGIAGGVSNIVDVVKSRWQISVLATTEENSSTRRIIQHMLSQDGLASFTRGIGARILWMIPSVTISMSIFEWFKAHGFA